MSAPDTKLPNIAALLCLISGLLIGAIGGLGSGSILGGIVSGIGVIPACWGIWAGMQQKTQGGLLWSIVLVFACLGVAGLLIVLRIFDMGRQLL